MPYYLHMGDVPRKRHTRHRGPDGSLRHEEVIGAEGFSGIASIAYHIYPPTLVERLHAPVESRVTYADTDFLRHRHLRGQDLPPHGDWIDGRRVLLGNSDVRIALCVPTREMDCFYRNASCDELVFIHDGAGVLETQLGHVTFRQGDYVHVPRTLTHRWRFDEGTNPRLLVIEATSEISFPKRYRNQQGQLLEHSPYCERDIRGPDTLETIDARGEYEIRIRKHGFLHRYVMRHHPFDIVGWDGCMYPYALSIHDFEPITGRIHQPPPVHQTFAGRNFVVCSFVPRMLDYHAEAIPIPYNHSNIDSDEMLYYAEGDFSSRRGIRRGAFTLHPGGIPHGPHPGTRKASFDKTRTDELAVMVDTFRPLNLTQAALDIEDADYWSSWQP